MAILDGRQDPEIGRVFAIGTGEVTVEQFQRFDPEHEYYEERSPTPDCPVGLVDWIRAARYCGWLSRELEADPDNGYPASLTANNFKVPAESVVESGAYRLPTFAEWRFACAALTTSHRYYGYSDSLGDDYFWYYETSLTKDRNNRYHPAGTKMPNDFGIFSTYDGVREWCTDGLRLRRFVMGYASSGNVDRAHTRLNLPKIDEPADLPLASNGYYGLRVAMTMSK